MPDNKPEDNNLIHTMKIHVNLLIKRFFCDPQHKSNHKYDGHRQTLDIFLENVNVRGVEVANVIKAGVADKRIGGRYKSSKIVQFLKTNLT